VAAEAEQGEGDEGLRGLEPERHPGDQPDLGVGRLDQAVGQVLLDRREDPGDDYDRSIWFFVDVLGCELVEDSPSLTNDGRLKRWVVVRRPGATSSLLLAKADGERQLDAGGDQFGGRVGLFLRVDDFEAAYARMPAWALSSSPSRGRSSTERSSSSSTSPGTGGICSGRDRTADRS
jgi:hypothetical protein